MERAAPPWLSRTRAIRDDERVVVLFGLPRELVPDPAHVDEVAVERACSGERVRLTRAERTAAARRLRAAGLSRNRVAERLGLSGAELAACLAGGRGAEDEAAA